MDQEEGISAEEQARRRLRSKQPARRLLTDDEAVSKRLKREATSAAIKEEILKAATERPDLEQSHKFYASIRTLRSPKFPLKGGVKNGGDGSKWTNVQCTLGG